MAAITIANKRAGVLLHKLILLELILAMAHGTFTFVPEPAYGWYLASTATGLIISWSLHNVISWMKNRLFMGRRLSLFYIGAIILVQPYWAIEIYANFAYFNNINVLVYEKIRPWEALFRDPWWIYTTCNLFWVVKTYYNFGILELVQECPRFGLMLGSMCLSIACMGADIASVTGALRSAMPLGTNPFWKKLNYRAHPTFGAEHPFQNTRDGPISYEYLMVGLNFGKPGLCTPSISEQKAIQANSQSEVGHAFHRGLSKASGCSHLRDLSSEAYKMRRPAM
ncbi:conserved hypothetical protein [Talaromyces stipitatus ATCC 10500]|uniref:Uncharacterized protein n=1 Tax=Talaromyces stipitatus (strain ATCC 10500 / CBS 375.48 / QM 6759 / NRRL 1006) TaxID=441959 RepID=B8MJN6_TALSN|nr:uncharacterized protein TSTA_051720 [Talaromyces stipitatus ATCC 10500]EED15735.1 conserved hypothetical protein [Talaromyces stipitatus ATCC 10500]